MSHSSGGCVQCWLCVMLSACLCRLRGGGRRGYGRAAEPAGGGACRLAQGQLRAPGTPRHLACAITGLQDDLLSISDYRIIFFRFVAKLLWRLGRWRTTAASPSSGRSSWGAPSTACSMTSRPQVPRAEHTVHLIIHSAAAGSHSCICCLVPQCFLIAVVLSSPLHLRSVPVGSAEAAEQRRQWRERRAAAAAVSGSNGSGDGAISDAR